MKWLILVLVLSSLITGCYTRFYEGDPPGSYPAIMGREYFVPNDSDSPFYEDISLLYGHWIIDENSYGVQGSCYTPDKFYDVFIKKGIDTVILEEYKPEYIFYPDGSLVWSFALTRDIRMYEKGKWGLCEYDPERIKLVGTTRYMRRIFNIVRLSNDSLYLNDPDKPPCFNGPTVVY